MCLLINTTRHPSSKNFRCGYAPLVAKRPIQVIKVLTPNKYSPVYPFNWSPRFGRMVESEVHTSPVNYNYRGSALAEKGLYAYRSLRDAKCDFNHLYNFHVAWIPTGAKYYLGRDGDIVSNGLIVTKDLAI